MAWNVLQTFLNLLCVAQEFFFFGITCEYHMCRTGIYETDDDVKRSVSRYNATRWRHINFNTLRPRQNGRHLPYDIFKCIFFNENTWISITFSLKFVPKGPINNIPALVQIMAWRRSGDKPLSEPMMVSLTTHICVTQPQWVKKNRPICIITNYFHWW